MTRLVLLAATAAALCWPAADEDAKPLFWLHAPKTGSSLREFLVDYSCGPPARPESPRSRAAQDLALTRRLDRADASLDVAEAVRRLRECFPFVGLQERWGESLWLFSRTMRGAAPFSAARAAVNTRPGAYDREMVRHLGDYVDRDTELYAAAVQIYEERLAAARQGKTCI